MVSHQCLQVEESALLRGGTEEGRRKAGVLSQRHRPASSIPELATDLLSPLCPTGICLIENNKEVGFPKMKLVLQKKNPVTGLRLWSLSALGWRSASTTDKQRI